MKHIKYDTKRRRIQPIAVIRAVVQLASFILVPGLFITVFYALNQIFGALIAGSFVFSEQVSNILLAAAAFLITFLWGRVFCGFICSFGAMQDLMRWIGKRLKLNPTVPPKADRVLKYLKYFVLAFVIFGIWGFGLMGNTVWSPWTVFGAAASPWNGLPAMSVILSLGGFLLLATMIGSMFIERFFCKYLCPLGALFAITSHFRVIKLKRNPEQCSGKCRACTRKCSMSIPLYRYSEVNSGECINCMKCVSACPQGNIKADALPAVSGTMAAIAMAGVCFVGTLPTANSEGKTATAVSSQSSFSDVVSV